MKFQQVHLRVDENTYSKIKSISEKRGESISDVIRKLIDDGLSLEIGNENKDIIASVVREELKAVLKPNVERLAALSSKSGHMAATAAFLNVQALMDLVPKERQRNVREMYENARKKAVEYMRTKTDDFDTKDLDRGKED
jgi:negative regulator of replication initiation